VQAAKEFGDERRSPIVERAEAQAFSENEIMPSEPVTVVLSDKGWIRAAKGHDIDPTALSYKAGDSFKFAALGKSQQNALLLDSTGRSYALPANSLPSARSQGEPLTGKLNPPSGAEFCGLLMGDDNQPVLLASDAGYGFIATFGDLYSKNRAGKTLLTLPEGAKVIAPIPLQNPIDGTYLVAVTNEGRMLVFPVNDLPVLPKGKGNKIIGIPSDRLIKREEFLAGLAVINQQSSVKIYSGKRHLTLNLKDMEHYMGERGRKGNKLPRGFQLVDRVETI
jgi:topoisomerase IV subunit A